MDSSTLAVFRDIVGADRGINVNHDVVTVDGVRYNLLWNEYQELLQTWNERREALHAILTSSTTDSSVQVPLDGGNWDFERESEFGVPLSARGEPKYYLMGYPYDGWDGRVTFTRKFLRNATREHVDTQFRLALDADDRLLFREIMHTLTTPRLEGSRLTNDEGVQVYSLYAGSSDDLPPRYAGRTFSPGHNHYLVSGAAQVDGGDLKALIDHIEHHGYATAGTGERIVILVHPDQSTDIRGFRRGEASGNGVVSPYDFIPSDANAAFLTAENIVGDKPPSTFAGLSIIGSYGNAYISESYFVPTGYLVAVATAGPNSARNVLAFREHPQPVHRGLIQIPGEQPNDPLTGSTFWRGFGVGVRHRGGAAVMQIKASGSYDAPTWTP